MNAAVQYIKDIFLFYLSYFGDANLLISCFPFRFLLVIFR